MAVRLGRAAPFIFLLDDKTSKRPPSQAGPSRHLARVCCGGQFEHSISLITNNTNTANTSGTNFKMSFEIFSVFFSPPPVVGLTKGVVVNQESQPAVEKISDSKGFGGNKYVISQAPCCFLLQKLEDLNG